MDAVTKFFGQDAESKLNAAAALVTQKQKELADAEAALAALQAPSSGTVSDGVQGGRKRKSRSTRRRTGRRSTRS
jgi:hypothetical protein